MSDVFIYDAVRTVRGKGKPSGALAGVPPRALVAQVIEAMRQRGVSIDDVNRLHLGCVGQTGAQGGHIALVSRIAAGLDDTVVATSLNNFCVSGLTAIGQAAAMVRHEGGLALAGGVESMSQVPYLADAAPHYVDPVLARELGYAPVAVAADAVATLHGFERADLDRVTLESHRRAALAWRERRFDSAVIPVRDQSGAVVLDSDELVREGLTAEKLAALLPAFAAGAEAFGETFAGAASALEAIEPRHSVANCPGICDGAALAVVGPSGFGAPAARILGFAEVSSDRVLQLTGGIEAMKQVLSRARMSLADIDLIELMEAFAVVPLLFRHLCDVDPARINVDGGHLAMGHPMGATGAVLVSQAVDVMKRHDAETSMVVAQGGSGVAAAIILERV